MDIPGSGKSPNSSFSFRYNPNNELLEELYSTHEVSKTPQSEGSSPKRVDKTPSLIDKYFKRDRTEKSDEFKSESPKTSEDTVPPSVPKEATSSPVKEYLASRLGKKSTAADVGDVREPPNETWRLFHDFKFRIAQAVEDIKLRSNDDEKNKPIVRDSSMSDSEENSVTTKDSESVEDTDNQVSSLESSINNLSEVSQPLTAKANDEVSFPKERTHSESTDDTHKNLDSSESENITKDLDDNLIDVESGVEALEDANMSAQAPAADGAPGAVSAPPSPPLAAPKDSPRDMLDVRVDEVEAMKFDPYFFTPILYVTTGLLLMTYFFCSECQLWNGFVLGIWVFSLISSAKRYVMQRYFGSVDDSAYRSVQENCSASKIYTIPSVKEYTAEENNYEGWINHYRYPDYFAESYNLNKTTTAFMKLEGTSLRISYTGAKVGKRAMWDERIPPPAYYQHRVYSLAGARVALLPAGLVARRLWSKKYPICVQLREGECVQVLERDGRRDEDPETSSGSPVKRRRFVWRRREKPAAVTAAAPAAAEDPPTTRDGLRHRFGKKLHKEKRAEAVAGATADSGATATAEAEAEPEFADAEDARDDDDEDLAALADVLNDADPASAPDDGEWSVHVRRTKARQCLYLFGRTGRDKHEWYRRLLAATYVPRPPSAEASAAEERPEDRDRESTDAVYRVSERDSVSFSKPNQSKPELAEPPPPPPPPPDALAAHETAFWPYFLRIVEARASAEPPLIDCELLWLNAVIARFMYDFMHNEALLQRLQHKVQLKLNTIKLPSFMSPLLVTSLSLSGAPPLVECVGPARWDAAGLSVDARVRYAGGAAVAVLTQINLLKLKERSHLTVEEQTEQNPSLFGAINVEDDTSYSQYLRERKPAIFDSDMEDSAESSSDDDTPPLQPVDSSDALQADTVSNSSLEPSSSKKKFFRMVDKIATSKYFQTVTDYKYVKRAMEGLSNTDIKLHVEVCRLEGRVALQLPPPPHDRLWLGFHASPKLVLKARPAFGARSLRFAHITNWIEQKLLREFEKVLVLPNMEDIYIPVMTPTPVDFCPSSSQDKVQS